MQKKLIPFFLTSVFILQPAFAQTTAPAPAAVEKSEVEKPASPSIYSPILPVKIKPRQGGADSISKAAADIEQENKLDPDSLGLYTRISDGGLGSDVWKDYTATKLAEDLAGLNLDITSPTLRSLLLRALLTAPDTTTFVEDTTTSEAFSSRLAALINLGSFDETVTLYKKLEGNIPSADAALAGAEAIFSTSQMGLACLEEKALSAELKQSNETSFWPDLNSFCRILLMTDASLDDKASFDQAASAFIGAKKMTAPSTLAELNKKSLIEIITMSRSGLLTKSLFTPENVRTLKPQIISLLLKQSLESQNAKLSLLAVAAEEGIVPVSDFTNTFMSESAVLTTPGYWQPILSAYSKTQATPSDVTKAVPLKEVLKMIPSSKNAALLPFAATFGSVKNVDAFTPEESRKVLGLLIRSKINVSGAWFAQAFNKPDAKTRESVTDLEVISALKNIKEQKNSETGKTGDVSDKKDKKDDKKAQVIEIAQLDTLSLILANQEAEDKPAEKSYEKLFSLTGQNDYVMPSMELINNLTESSRKQDTGKVIIYSLQALNGQRVSQLHPLALFRISEGLQSVGLSEENRSLAHEVLADLIEY